MSAAIHVVPALDSTRISERADERAHFESTFSDRWERQAREVIARKDSYFPSHVLHCANNKHNATGIWSLGVWRKSTPLAPTIVPYTCGSYRCPSAACQRHAAHSSFARISEALEREGQAGARPDGWVSLVLTVDSLGTLTEGTDSDGVPWRESRDPIQHCYRELSRMTRNFIARLKRWAEENGWETTGNRWVSTVEAQRSGWPHINLLIYSPGLADWLRVNLSEVEGQPGALRGRLRDAAIGTSWGAVGYAEPARNSTALAGYLVKLAGNHDASVGEIAKLTQSPTNARHKLRRIRAGKGFLRALPKNPDFTGIMLRRVRTISGLVAVEPLMKPDQVRCPEGEQDAYLLGVRTSMALELERAVKEEAGIAVKTVSRPRDRVDAGPTIARAVPGVEYRGLEIVRHVGEREKQQKTLFFSQIKEKSPAYAGHNKDMAKIVRYLV